MYLCVMAEYGTMRMAWPRMSTLVDEALGATFGLLDVDQTPSPNDSVLFCTRSRPRRQTRPRRRRTRSLARS